MAQQWPAGLQDKLNTASFSYVFGETAITSEMETGKPKKRRRYTKGIDTIAGSIDLTFEQFSDLKTFHSVTLNGGVDTFLFTHPFEQVDAEFQFINTPTIAPKSTGGRTFVVSFQWREIP